VCAPEVQIKVSMVNKNQQKEVERVKHEATGKCIRFTVSISSFANSNVWNACKIVRTRKIAVLASRRDFIVELFEAL